MFLQPDSSSCVPTTFAYLAAKQLGLRDGERGELLAKVLLQCQTALDLPKNGMSFLELQEVVKELGFATEVSEAVPSFLPYMAGVQRLPIATYESSSLLDTSISDGSLEITDNFFIYPEGHAVAVFEGNDTNKVRVFDSFVGGERELLRSDVMDNLEAQSEFLRIKTT